MRSAPCKLTWTPPWRKSRSLEKGPESSQSRHRSQECPAVSYAAHGGLGMWDAFAGATLSIAWHCLVCPSPHHLEAANLLPTPHRPRPQRGLTAASESRCWHPGGLSAAASTCAYCPTARHRPLALS